MNFMSQIDVLMQAQFPTVMVPIVGALSEMDTSGHRFLMANNGVWIQVKRSWLHAVLPVTSTPKVTVPYGAANMECQTRSFPKHLLHEFGSFAKQQYPNECAARIVQDKKTNLFRLEKMVPTSVSEGHVAYAIPVLGVDEDLVVDIHSHGTFDAFFSEADNKDDAHEVKVAAVIGFPKGVSQAPTWCFRLCVNGIFEKIIPVQIEDKITFKLEY